MIEAFWCEVHEHLGTRRSLGGVVSGGVVGSDLRWILSFLLTYIIIYLDY